MCSEPNSFPAAGMADDPQIAGDADRGGSTCSVPLDCGDLAETFRTDKSARFHRLRALTPTQFNLQALAYAAYLNQLHSLDLNMDDILAGWQHGLGFDTR
jgi:hypothetical protein